MAILEEIKRDEVKANLKRVHGEINKTMSQLERQVQQHVAELQAMAQHEALSDADKADVQSILDGLPQKIDETAANLKTKLSA